MKVVPIKKDAPIQRLINWLQVCRVDKDGKHSVIYFTDGRFARDSRTPEELWEIVKKVWGK